MPSALRDKAVEIMKRCQDMTLATLREDGFPQATVVSFAHDGLSVVFGCGAKSQKARNLARDPRVAMTMTERYRNWSQIRGLNMAAMAYPLSGAQIGEAAALLVERFPQAVEEEPIIAGTLKLFRLRPMVISVLDYTLGFGHTETLEPSEDEFGPLRAGPEASVDLETSVGAPAQRAELRMRPIAMVGPVSGSRAGSRTGSQAGSQARTRVSGPA